MSEGITLLQPRSPEPEIGGFNTQYCLCTSWMLFVVEVWNTLPEECVLNSLGAADFL